jgi:hypothetical protein
MFQTKATALVSLAQYIYIYIYKKRKKLFQKEKKHSPSVFWQKKPKATFPFKKYRTFGLKFLQGEGARAIINN